MKVQNTTGLNYTSFKAKAPRPGDLFNAFKFIIDNNDKQRFDTFIPSSQENEKPKASTNPISYVIDKNDEATPVEILPEEDDKQTSNSEEVLNLSEQEETAVPCEDEEAESLVEEEAESNIEDGIIENEDESPLESDVEPETEDNTQEEPEDTVLQSAPKHLDTTPVTKYELLAHLDNYQPRHAKKEGIPIEEALKLEPNHIFQQREKTSKQIITERLNWYKGKRETIPVSGRMFDAICELKPETLRAFKNYELLFLLVAKQEVLERMFKKDTLKVEERINMLHEMENAFTPEEISKISFDDEDNIDTILNFAKWLFTSQTRLSKENTVKYLKNVPQSMDTGIRSNIIEYLTPPTSIAKLKMFLKGFKRRGHRTNID